MATQDKYIKTALRLPRDLHADVQDSAKGNGRSMNAEIIYMLQSYFDKVMSLPINGNPDTNAALVKTLRFKERIILMERVTALGGTEEVLKAKSADINKKIEGDGITRSNSENISYYSKLVGQTPITALLTTEEIQKIAERLNDMQTASKKLADKTKPKKQ